MTIIFNNNFDDEDEGTAPDDWTDSAIKPCANLEIDDTQSHSAPHSMWIRAPAGNQARAYHDGTVIDEEPITLWVYFPTLSVGGDHKTIIYSLGQVGDPADADTMAYIMIYTGDGSGDIRYYDNGYKDTGVNAHVGWNKFTIVHNLSANTFDLYYEGVKIITGGFYFLLHTATTIKSVACQTGGPAFDPTEMWVDDVIIGVWTGKLSGIENPAKVSGIDVGNIATISGI